MLRRSLTLTAVLLLLALAALTPVAQTAVEWVRGIGGDGNYDRGPYPNPAIYGEIITPPTRSRDGMKLLRVELSDKSGTITVAVPADAGCGEGDTYPDCLY